MSDALRGRVENFLYEEARLMDENRYQDWLTLFADDCVYWIPSNKHDADPSREVSILYADRPILENHVQRLAEGKAFAQSPASRLRRIVSNIEVYPGEPVTVFCNFLITEIRRHVQRQHAGRSEYRLLDTDDALCVQYKKVVLLSIDEPQDNITFLL